MALPALRSSFAAIRWALSLNFVRIAAANSRHYVLISQCISSASYEMRSTVSSIAFGFIFAMVVIILIE